MKKLLAMLLATAMMVSFAACGDKKDNTTTKKTTAGSGDSSETTTTTPDNAVSGDADSKDAFVVWAWNDDFKKILDGPFKEAYPDDYKRIVFVNCGGTNYYQPKIDQMLKDKNNKLYPDIMCLEVDYVKKYVNGENLLNLKDIGIKESDYAGQYKYNVQLGSDFDGNFKASFWQATPGGFQVRADLAKQYLGTDDPAELQEKYFSSYDKIVDAAAKVASESTDGKVKLLAGYQDLYRPFANSRKDAWYDKNDKIQVDDNMSSYLDYCKKLYDNKGTLNAGPWGPEWQASMAGDGVTTDACICMPGCPWFTYYCLKDPWNNNTIMVDGPSQYYFGGTGVAPTKYCSDKDLAAKIIKTCTMDKDFMEKISIMNSDFLNNKEANQDLIAKIKDGTVDNCPRMYNNQNFLEFYLDKADKIDASTVRAEDNDIMGTFNNVTDQYAQGKQSKDEAIKSFKDLVHDTYSFLKK